MFGSAASEVHGAGPNRLLVPAIGVLVVGMALAGIYVWNRPHTAAAAASASSAAAGTGLAAPRAAGRHADRVRAWFATRIAGRTINGLSAVAFTFDRQGTFRDQRPRPARFPQLGAGDESPFSISVPQSAGVSRYRVSFRTDDGVVPHLDRREASRARARESSGDPMTPRARWTLGLATAGASPRWRCRRRSSRRPVRRATASASARAWI